MSLSQMLIVVYITIIQASSGLDHELWSNEHQSAMDSDRLEPTVTYVNALPPTGYARNVLRDNPAYGAHPGIVSICFQSSFPFTLMCFRRRALQNNTGIQANIKPTVTLVLPGPGLLNLFRLPLVHLGSSRTLP